MDLKDIFAPIQGHLTQVDTVILGILSSDVPVIDTSSRHLFTGGGKKIRAALVLLSAMLRDEVPEGIHRIAAATEILHAGTLVHDDIIDHAFLRRGNVTVSEKYGNKVAVLAGDYMYTTALDVVLEDGNPDLFPVVVRGTRDLVAGELYQMQFSNVEKIDRQHYYRIIYLKTAQFLSACIELGALKAGFSGENLERMKTFGVELGYAFQIVDDTLDLLVDQKETGKDFGNDLKDGKVTLPLILMLENKAITRETLEGFSQNPGDEDWANLKGMVQSSGAVEESIAMATTHIEKALKMLDYFAESKTKNVLIDLADFFINRRY